MRRKIFIFWVKHNLFIPLYEIKKGADISACPFPCMNLWFWLAQFVSITQRSYILVLSLNTDAVLNERLSF
jgi:hypothetical protein